MNRILSLKPLYFENPFRHTVRRCSAELDDVQYSSGFSVAPAFSFVLQATLRFNCCVLCVFPPSSRDAHRTGTQSLPKASLLGVGKRRRCAPRRRSLTGGRDLASGEALVLCSLELFCHVKMVRWIIVSEARRAFPCQHRGWLFVGKMKIWSTEHVFRLVRLDPFRLGLIKRSLQLHLLSSRPWIWILITLAL